MVGVGAADSTKMAKQLGSGSDGTSAISRDSVLCSVDHCKHTQERPPFPILSRKQAQHEPGHSASWPRRDGLLLGSEASCRTCGAIESRRPAPPLSFGTCLGNRSGCCPVSLTCELHFYAAYINYMRAMVCEILKNAARHALSLPRINPDSHIPREWSCQAVFTAGSCEATLMLYCQAGAGCDPSSLPVY